MVMVLQIHRYSEESMGACSRGMQHVAITGVLHRNKRNRANFYVSECDEIENKDVITAGNCKHNNRIHPSTHLRMKDCERGEELILFLYIINCSVYFNFFFFFNQAFI